MSGKSSKHFTRGRRGGTWGGGNSIAQNNLKMERVKIITELMNSGGRGGVVDKYT